MLTSKDFYYELEKLEDALDRKDVTLEDVLKGVTLVMKLGKDLRTNQVSIMRHLGIDMRRPIKKEDTTSDEN